MAAPDGADDAIDVDRGDAAVVARVARVLRDIARGGIAASIAGLLVGGVGGRIAMTIAAVLNPDAAGRRTENGELVGVFTINGTLALLVFGGLLTGVLAGVVWVVVSPWLPARGWGRAGLAAVGAVALFGFFVVQSTNTDFRILDPDVLLVAMFLGLVGLAGAVTVLLDDRLERRLPHPGDRPWRSVVGYGAFALLGAPAFLLTLSAYFSPAFSRAAPPTLVGWALVAVGLVTGLWWASRVVAARREPPRILVAAGRIALLASVALGAAHMATHVTRILAG